MRMSMAETNDDRDLRYLFTLSYSQFTVKYTDNLPQLCIILYETSLPFVRAWTLLPLIFGRHLTNCIDCEDYFLFSKQA
jgi:hypothetical protein